MEQKYIALETKSFTEGQALADIIKGNFYMVDAENEYFVGEFNDTIYMPKEQIPTYFKKINIKSYQQRTKRKYRDKQTTLYITLFPSDKDIIDHLEKVTETVDEKKATKGGKGGKSEYIRKLIREDIQRSKQ